MHIQNIKIDTELPMTWNFEAIKSSLLSLGGKDKFKVPDMPDVVIQLDKEMRSRYPNARVVAEIIESNTVITGEILKIIRSPVYQKNVKGATEVKKIMHVVNLVGIKKTYEFAVAAAIRSFPNKSSLFRSIIDYSSDVAIACAEISTYVYGVSFEDAYLFGLFKEGGAISLAATLEDRYEKCWASHLTFPASAVIHELSNINARHDVLGVAAARHWGFGKNPDEIDMIYAIQEHHNYEQIHLLKEKPRLLVAIGMLADVLVSEINADAYRATESNEIKQIALDVLCLPEEAMRTIRANVVSALIGRS